MNEYITFKVKCPRDDGCVHTMPLTLADLGNGKYLPMPCIGCNFCHEHRLCNMCMYVVTKMAIDDPFMRTYPQPINPYNYPQYIPEDL